MQRPLLLLLALTCSLLGRGIDLREVSQTPMAGAEAARCLLFDRQGLMWIGTEQGLLSYDGYQFRSFRSDAYHPGILPNNFVRALAEDHDDGLWIGTRDGLVRHDRRTGDFRTYHLQGEQQRVINTLFTTRDGTVWTGTSAGANRYDAKSDTFRHYPMPSGVMAFAEDASGHLYIGMWDRGLVRLDPATGRTTTYPQLTARNTIYTMLTDSRNRLWIGTWENGIVRLDNPADTSATGIHHYNSGRSDFRTYYQIVEDTASNAVWGCCLEGVTAIDMDDDNHVENIGGRYMFCNSIQTDGNGNLWILTRNEGVVHASTIASPFTQWTLPEGGLPLPADRVRTLFTADGNRFWIGLHPYGLALYDRRQGTAVYGNSIGGLANMKGIEEIYKLTVNAITAIGDELWMATSRGILIWKEGSEGELLSAATTPPLRDAYVNAIYRQKNGVVWVGQSGQACVLYDKTRGQRLTMRAGDDDFSLCDVRAISEDRQGRIWIATDNEGIISVSGDSRRPQTLAYRHYHPKNGKYPIDDATACYEDSHHRLWAISNSGGLFLYNRETDRFDPVNERYHIDGGRVYTIEEDETGSLWLTTEQALVRLTFTDGDEQPAVATYGREDGLLTMRSWPRASFRHGKEFFFGNGRGFFAFTLSPRLAALSSQKPRFVVTNPLFAKEMTIPADKDRFTVEFALLTYSHQQHVHYMYRLEGYDSRWHDVGTHQHSISFQNLPPGTYRLHLKARDSYGRWTPLPYPITISVLPPWYRTWWAYMIYLLLLTATVYATTQWYKNRIKRRARLQQRVNELLHYRELVVMQQFNDQKAISAEEREHTSPDEQFLSRAIDLIKQHIDDSEYDREQFASDMCVSSSTLYNKLRALTGQTVTGFINSVRLKEARRIARENPTISVAELSMAVGFNTPKYFTKLFKKEFDLLPSEYIEQVKNGQ